jgi:hypothetical protein
MSYVEIRRNADRVRAIPLETVLELAGARRDRHDRAKWHTKSGVLSVTGAKFMDWHLSAGGGGAIDLVIHLMGLDFKGAVAWLCHRFPDADPSQRAGRSEEAPPAGRQLRLPRRDPGKLALVLRYLVGERRLPRSVLVPLVERGVLYADERANAVFLMLAEDGRPAGAELRGTGRRPFRSMAKGSRKDLGCFSVPAPGPRRVVLCESAVDALSCHALYPGFRCVSTAGARPDPLWLGPLLRGGHEILCGFDADETGDAMARAMTALHPAVTRLRPPRKDWNDVLRSNP